MRIGRNLFASVSHSAWSAIASLVAVPFLIRFLGVESYGLVGLYAATLSMLYVLDLGLAPAVNREVAANKVKGQDQDSAILLKTLEPIYWSMAGLIALVFYLLAPAITSGWLNAKSLNSETLIRSVTLIGLVIACRWPAALYQNAIMGAQRLTITSMIGIFSVTLAQAGGVLVVWLWSSTVEAFFGWQLFCAIVHTQLMRVFAWNIVGHKTEAYRDIRVMKRVWRFSLGMTGVAITTVLLAQMDKLLLSTLLSLEDFGKYAIAVLLASGLYVLLAPTFNNIFPRFSALIAAGNMDTLALDYRRGTRLLSCVLFPIAIAGALFSEELLSVWTGNDALAHELAPVLAILLLGGSFNGVMLFPYALQLAAGMPQLSFWINIGLCFLFAPMLYFLAINLGMLGGATAWLGLNSIYLLIGTLVTHRFLLKGLASRWLLFDVLSPLTISLLLLTLGNSLGRNYFVSHWGLLGASVVVTLFTITVCLCFCFPSLLTMLIKTNLRGKNVSS